MKALLWLAVLLLLVAGGIFLGAVPFPMGQIKSKQICTQCGQVRQNQGNWLFSPGNRWVGMEGAPSGTPVSAFLQGLGERPCDRHAWRGYWGHRYHWGYAMITLEGARHPLMDAVKDEEKALGALDPAVAAEAVRARLADSKFDEGLGTRVGQQQVWTLKLTPPWFSVPGWPPKTAEEARAWWKGAKP